MEIDDITAFLASTAPFDALDTAGLQVLARTVSVRYAKRGSQVLTVGDANAHLYIVRSGAVELKEMGASLTARLGEGYCFAYPSLLRDGTIRNGVTAIEDTLLYLVPVEVFHDLRQRDPAIRQFFAGAEAERLRAVLAAAAPGGSLVGGMQTLETLLRRAAVCCTEDTPLQAAARKMVDEAVSSLLITQEETLVGIVTDRDMRARALATGMAPDTPIGAIMTADPVTVAPTMNVMDALLLMSERELHHLPVVDGAGRPLGLVSANDILAAQAVGAVPIGKTVRKAATTDEINSSLARMPQMVVKLMDAGVDGAQVAGQVASIGYVVHRRIIQLAEDALGPPPVPYCYLVFGSLARRDQTLKTDQDNGLLLDDSYDAAAHGGYFKALSERVSADLDACGFDYCGGDIMAQNPKWRQPLAGWKAVFEDWIRAPEPKALMHASIFFDSAPLYGDESLYLALQGHVLQMASKRELFLAHMVQNALTSQVPIGFFRRFVLTSDKNQEDRLDIKKNGLVPLVDIVRVYALKYGIQVPGFEDRVRALEEASSLAPADLQEMRDAWHFLMTIRLEHQARQIRRGETPDNMIAPQHLSTFEREHLRDAFSLIKGHQGGLSRALAGGQY